MPSPPGTFLHELKRRNLFRVAIAFLAASWLLLQVVDTVAPLLGLPDEFGRWVLLILAIGFPVTLILAWIFELTPEGIRRDSDLSADEKAAPGAGRKLDFIIIGALATGLLFSVYLNVIDHGVDGDVLSTGAGRTSGVAVLPFSNRSANASDAFFVDGIHDELLTTLAKISSLRVISRTSVLKFRDTTRSMPSIGAELGVGSLLEGAVQRSGNRIRIIVQLIDAENDRHIWADTYDREMTANNLFEIQAEISRRIAEALDATLSPEEERRVSARPTNDIEAYEALLSGRQQLYNDNTASVRNAVTDFQRAIELDSKFAPAYVGLAESYLRLAELGDMTNDEMPLRVRPLAEQALEIDDRDGGVYQLLGTLAEREGDFELAESYYRRAIDLAPEYAMARLWLGMMLKTHTLRLEESAEMYRQTIELDPLGADIRAAYGVLLTEMGDITGGLRSLQSAIDIDPGYVDPYASIGYVHFYGLGDATQAMLWQQKAASMEPLRAAQVANLFAALGDFETAEAWIDAVLATSPDQPNALAARLAIRVAEGDADGAEQLASQLLTDARDYLPANIPLFALRNAELARSAPERALEHYLEHYPRLAGPSPDIDKQNVVAAVDLVLVLQHLGHDSDALELARVADEYLQLVPSGPSINTNALRAELAAMIGNDAAALEFLERAVEENWLGYWWAAPDSNPNIESMHGHPGYQSLMEKVRAQLEIQRSSVRELQAQGRLAYTPDQLLSMSIELPLN